MSNSLCGIDCSICEMNKVCNGCIASNGRPFGSSCMVAVCCVEKGNKSCNNCQAELCKLREQLISEFNNLGIKDLGVVTELYSLKGSFVNIKYTLPGGQQMKMWDDNKIYLGNQLHKKNSDRCYGIVADEKYLMVCEYSDGGGDPEIVIFKRR